MPSFTQEQYTNAFNNIPQKIEEVLFADSTAEAIKNITNRHEVTDNAFDISAAIGYVLVGLLPIKNFIKALQEDAGLNAETAKNVAHDIREQIFSSIAQELSEIQKQVVLDNDNDYDNNKVLDESVVSEHQDNETRNMESYVRGSDVPTEVPDSPMAIREGAESIPIPKPPVAPKPHKEVPESHTVNLRDPRF